MLPPFLYSSSGDGGSKLLPAVSLDTGMAQGGLWAGRMAEAEVKGGKEWLLQTFMVSHTQLVCKRAKGPAPSERNRCLNLRTTRSFWNRRLKDHVCLTTTHADTPPIQRSKFGENGERKGNG